MTTMNNEDPADPSVHEPRQAPMPCPFCGHVGLAFGDGSKFRWLAYYCDGCGMGGETRMQTTGDGTPEKWRERAERDAIEAWNTRTPDAAAAEAEREANAALCDRFHARQMTPAECAAAIRARSKA